MDLKEALKVIEGLEKTIENLEDETIDNSDRIEELEKTETKLNERIEELETVIKNAIDETEGVVQTLNDTI